MSLSREAIDFTRFSKQGPVNRSFFLARRLLWRASILCAYLPFSQLRVRRTSRSLRPSFFPSPAGVRLSRAFPLISDKAPPPTLPPSLSVFLGTRDLAASSVQLTWPTVGLLLRPSLPFGLFHSVPASILFPLLPLRETNERNTTVIQSAGLKGTFLPFSPSLCAVRGSAPRSTQ